MSLYKSGGTVLRAFLGAGAALLAATTIAYAQQDAPSRSTSIAESLFEQTPAPIIQGIQVTGNQRIEADTVGSYLPLQPGMPADEELLDLSLKTLFRTGLFSDVKLEMQPSGMLLITVSENPIVNRVIFEGNRRLKDDKITEEIQLAARTVYTRAKVQADTQKIIELYRAKGRFATIVTPKVTPLEQNRIDVIFEIDEGPKTGVAKVNFVGNEVYTDNELRGVILTKESRWWRFFTNYDNYDPDRLEYERQLLREHYGQHGYADFQVVSAVAELTPDRKDFFITFTVDEGPQYTVGDVRVKTTLAKLNGDALANFVPIKPGQTFDSERVEKAVESITFATGTAGYAFVDVGQRLVRHPESNTIDLTFEVNEGPRVYVDRVNIKGNNRTLDKIIRREIRIAEGDAFNRVLVDRSKARVRSLGYFKEVEIEEKPGSAPDRTELDVAVTEQSTGSLSVGVGISSTENFIVDLSVEERNLLGRGQYLRFRVQASSRTRQVDLRFTQPYFLDRNLVAGGSLFNQRTNFRESGFVRNRIGAGLNAGFQVSEYGRGGINYLITRDSVTIDSITAQLLANGADPSTILAMGAMASSITPAVDATGAPVDENGDLISTSGGMQAQLVTANICDFLTSSLTPTCESRGKFLTSLVGFSLSFDTRDDPIRPRRGWRTAASVGVAGLGGDVNYYQTELTAAYYRPIIANFIGSLKGRIGYIDGWGGDNVRLSDRFFEGASTFRGFEVAGIGPRYLTSVRDGQLIGQAIGAKAYAIGTAEILLPLPLPDQYGIRVSLFSDFGTVGLVDDSTKALNDNPAFYLDFDGDPMTGVNGREFAPIQDELALRLTAGVSVSWDSPFGPVRFDFAHIFMKEEYDRTEGFRFSAGTNF
ncbi:outer membrane protein assembly factor BamA [Hyphococcus sp.]|uniref:outer membrane protein assembly factor BamA n=1 Tax=Hyphococcus sp. TaxID=2038636 RepID=UPI002085C745|nr:MAG: outer membrane protein assembly factor BamA [Marinicaulis sp.]